MQEVEEEVVAEKLQGDKSASQPTRPAGKDI